MVNSIANGHRRVAPAMGGTPSADKNPADKNPADKNPADKNPVDKNPADGLLSSLGYGTIKAR